MTGLASRFLVPVIGRGRASATFLLVTGILILAGLALAFGRGISHSALFLNDSFVFFDGIHRIVRGQTPNADFASPAGALTYLLPYFGFRLTGSYGGAVEMGSLLLAAPTLAAAGFLLWRRVAPAMSLLLLAAVGAVTVVPLVPGMDSDQVSHAMHYNRWGWGVLLTVFLLGLPDEGGTRRATATGLVTGALLSLLFFIKITYFIMGAAYLLLLVLFPDWRRRSGLLALLCAAVLICLATIVFQDVVFGYLASIREALIADTAVRGSYFNVALLSRTDLALLALATYAALFCRGLTWRDLLLAGFIAVSGLAIIDQNFQAKFIVTLPAAFAILAAASAREPGANPGMSSVIVAIAYLMLLPYALDWARVTLRYLRAPAGDAISFDAPGFTGFYYYDRTGDEGEIPVPKAPPADLEALLDNRIPTIQASHTQYLEAQKDGARLLSAVGADQSEIMTLDLTNTLPLMVDAPRRSPGYSWLHFGRNVSDETLPDGARMFNGVDYLMIPLVRLTPKPVEHLLNVYGSYLKEHATVIAQSDYWVLLKYAPGSGN